MGNFGELIRTDNRGLISSGADHRALMNAPSPLGVAPERIRATRVTIAPLMLDTSGSMETFIDRRTGEPCDGQGTVIRCYNNSLRELLPPEQEAGRAPRHRVVFGSFGFSGTICNWSLVEDVPPLTERDYSPKGGTPLYDLVGDCLPFALAKHRQLLDSGIPNNLVALIVSDAQERDSTRSTLERVQDLIAQVLMRRDNYIFGVALGDEAAEGLRRMGIGEDWIRDVSDPLGLSAIFREFSTMSTRGGGGRQNGYRGALRPIRPGG